MPPKTKPPVPTVPVKRDSSDAALPSSSERPTPSVTQSPVTLVPVDRLRDSAHLAADRLPRLDAIRALRDQVGGAAAFCSAEAADALGQLSPRERNFALLAASIASHGVEEPLVVRSTPTGLELVAGHRRRYAAELAEVRELPVRIVEGMSDEESAAHAARSNHNRAPLSAWQFARLANAIRVAQAEQAATVAQDKPRRVGAPQRPDSAAAVARVMGIGASSAKDYLMIATEINDEVVAKATPRLAEAHAALGRLPFRRLRAIAQIEGLDERAREIRLATGVEKVEKPKKRRRTFEVREGRQGSYVLRVTRVERLPLEDARSLLEFLTKEEQRVRARVELLSSILEEGAEQGQAKAA